MNNTLPTLLLAMSLIAGLSCQSAQVSKKSDTPQATAPPTNTIHSITLPAISVDLPAGPGKETVELACVLCHTPRYITQQPPFSQEAWTNEVQKMKKTYGAQVTDDQAKDIVGYLVSIRGAATQPATKP